MIYQHLERKPFENALTDLLLGQASRNETAPSGRNDFTFDLSGFSKIDGPQSFESNSRIFFEGEDLNGSTGRQSFDFRKSSHVDLHRSKPHRTNIRANLADANLTWSMV